MKHLKWSIVFNCFRQTLYIRCLTGFWKRLWICLLQSYQSHIYLLHILYKTTRNFAKTSQKYPRGSSFSHKITAWMPASLLTLGNFPKFSQKAIFSFCKLTVSPDLRVFLRTAYKCYEERLCRKASQKYWYCPSKYVFYYSTRHPGKVYVKLCKL